MPKKSGGKQQESKKGKPRSAGRHPERNQRAFSESANQRFCESRLRNVLRCNGVEQARAYAASHSRFGLEKVLERLLVERSTRRVAEKPAKKPTNPAPVPVVVIGPGGTGQGLGPMSMSLAEKFMSAGITPDRFPARRRRAPRPKKPAKTRVVAPDMSRVEPDKTTPIAVVLGSLLS